MYLRTCYWKFRFPVQIDIKIQTSLQLENDRYKKDHVFITTARWKDNGDSNKDNEALASEFARLFGVPGFMTKPIGALVTAFGAVLKYCNIRLVSVSGAIVAELPYRQYPWRTKLECMTM